MGAWIKSGAAHHPLLVMSLLAASGVWIADADAGSAGLWAVAAMLCLVAAWCWSSVGWLLAAVSMVLGTAQRVQVARTLDHPLRAMLPVQMPVTVRMEGEFTSVPMQREDMPGVARARFHFDQVELVVRRQRIHCGGEVGVLLDDPTLEVDGGRYVLRGDLMLTGPLRNPSLFDPQHWEFTQGLMGQVNRAQAARLGPARWDLSLAFLSAAEHCRAWIARALCLGLEEDETAQAVITTMALGTSDSDLADLAEPFRKTGTIHIFAVSGLHVTMMVMILGVVLAPLGLGRRRSVLAMLPLVLGYAFITGWAPSAARAAWMASVMMVVPLMQREARFLNSLGFAALVLLVADPLQLFQKGFQLSFLLVICLTLGVDSLIAPWGRWVSVDALLPMRVASWSQRFFASCRRWLVASLCTSFVACLSSLPHMTTCFHQCSPISVVANLVLVPLSFLSLWAVAASLMSAAIHFTWLQSLCNGFNAWIAHAMVGSATLMAQVPGGNFAVSVPPRDHSPPFRLSVLAMPPGQGAQLLESDGARWMLDCGHRRSWNRVTKAFLQHEAIDSLDGLLCSHADANHISAFLPLLRDVGAERMLIGPFEPWRFDARNTSMWKLVNHAKAEQIPLSKLMVDEVIRIGRVRMKVLYPSLREPADEADDRAMILRLDVEGHRILWMNDAGFAAEAALFDRYRLEALRCDVLIRQQHGSGSAPQESFLRAVRPRLVISSNAPQVPGEHIPQQLRVSCAKIGVPLLDQDRCGMVRLELKDKAMVVLTMQSGEVMRWLSSE